ncbi:hypothetical protein [Nocardia transvalensis]|uniref:hypothetical protein n=1 Tax=Nocardia transvalensis TaxID=37333 RepID=UPI000312CC59|nr:hypothetical protein [Nocardia transvalensis]
MTDPDDDRRLFDDLTANLAGDNDLTADLYAQALPEARRLRRALESLGITTYSGQPLQNPYGERGDAAQYAGLLAAVLEQYENGIRGGPLQIQWMKGWFTGHSDDIAAILSTLAVQTKDLAHFVGTGISRLPLASRQLATTALAMFVASRALLAAAEIASDTPNFTAAEDMSTRMVANAHELARYIAHLESEFGPVPPGTTPDIRIKTDPGQN